MRSRAAGLHRLGLGVLLIAALLLRLWGIKQGLPYSYNIDEATHFVPKAVGFFSHGLNPHYFLNPPGYSYLVFAVFERWFGSADAVRHAYAVLHNDAVLSRPDTRSLARAWMTAHIPAGSKVVIEPLVPDNWVADIGSWSPWTLAGDRWERYPTWLTDVDSRGDPLPLGQLRYVVVDQYERTLRPALLDEYASSGFCWLVIGSLQAGRAFAQPQAAPLAVTYYAQMAERSRLLFHVSPFSPTAHPVPFNFDWSIDYYPGQYRLPGPEVSVYRLTGVKCGP